MTRLRPRIRKILADLWSNKVRTLLVVLSIAVGTFAVGLVSSSYMILSTDIDADYRSVNPHAAVVYSEAFDEEQLAVIQRMPGVDQAEGRSALYLRVVRGPENKIPIVILGIPSRDEMHIDRLRIQGSQEQPPDPGDHEIYLEQSALTVFKVQPGDTIQVEIRGQRTRTLRVAGIVHDISVAPYMFTGQIAGYVNKDTMIWLGGVSNYNQVYLTVTERHTDAAFVTAVAQSVSDKIEKSGRIVYKTTIPTPGKHFASDFVTGMGILLGGLGILSVLLSALLAVNTITALLSQHVRQIGIMKLVGAQTNQLVVMYIGLVMTFGLLSLLIALPLSAYASYALSGVLANVLNFNLGGFRIPPLAIVLQVGVAILTPVSVAMVPVLNSTRQTVRAAITDTGLSPRQSGKNWLDRLIENIRGLPRPLLFSLRNVFRRKGRLALTLATLTLGGAIFIGVFNVRAALALASKQALGYFLSDVNVTLVRTHRFQEIEPLIRDIPGVVQVEGWGSQSAQVYSPDKATTEEVIISAPPAGSHLIQPVLTAGRWLTPDDTNALVISNALLKKRPDLKVGNTIEVKINGKDYAWQIIGICTIAGHMPTPLVYTNKEYLQNLSGNVDQIAEFHIVTSPENAVTQKLVAQNLETKLKRAQLQVSQITTGIDNSNRLVVVINLMVYMLLAMAVLIALVGGLGLTGMMSQNVLERTREIGIMRSIGAENHSIQQIVIVEGLVVGLISWVFGLFLAIPISLGLENALGDPIVGAQLPGIIFSWDGPLFWLIGVILLSAVSSFLPAFRASRLTIREVLAYE